MNALRQVMMAGTDEQRQRAVEVINEAKRKLYAILAKSSAHQDRASGTIGRTRSSSALEGDGGAVGERRVVQLELLASFASRGMS